MTIEELDNMRNTLHKQFINRQPADKDTVKIFVGIGSEGVTKEKSELLKALAEAVAEKGLNDTLCCFSTEFSEGVRIVKPNAAVVAVEKACPKCAGDIVAENLA